MNDQIIFEKTCRNCNVYTDLSNRWWMSKREKKNLVCSYSLRASCAKQDCRRLNTNSILTELSSLILYSLIPFLTKYELCGATTSCKEEMINNVNKAILGAERLFNCWHPYHPKYVQRERRGSGITQSHDIGLKQFFG